MPFSGNSYFYEDQGARESREVDPVPITHTHTGAPVKNVSVPVSVLEDWIHALEMIGDAYDGPELFDAIEAMRSYFPG